MGFSSQQYHREQEQRRWKVHPVWRGIGCALLILVPIMAWFATDLFLQSNQRIVLPWELTKVITVPYTKVVQIDRIIAQVNRYFDSSGLMYGQLFFTAIFSVVGFGVMAFLYAILYRVAGPSRYGPFDVPPDKI
jgi:hypothetical protein